MLDPFSIHQLPIIVLAGKGDTSHLGQMLGALTLIELSIGVTTGA